MRFTPLSCPDCGSGPKGTIENMTGISLLRLTSGEDYEYDGTTTTLQQETQTDPSGRVLLSCSEAHEWWAMKEVRR